MNDLSNKKTYIKTPLTLKEQVARLKSKGLIIDDAILAEKYLSNISYYRLRAYTYPFQSSDEDSNHVFTRSDIHFNDIIDLYCFDRRLRNLVFNAIEKIEVALRAKIVQVYSESTGDSHWYSIESLFRDDSYFIDGEEIFKFNELWDEIMNEVDRSNEDFIYHYKNRYDNPDYPPSWMTLEVVSFGTLSKIYNLLKKDDCKKKVAKMFGLNDISLLENWMHSLSHLRNCCAHHSRIWNRRFVVNISLPRNTDYIFLDRETIKKTRSNKLFAYLCCIKYLLDLLSPGNSFYANLRTLIAQGGSLLKIKDMGFPENWTLLGVWRN